MNKKLFIRKQIRSLIPYGSLAAAILCVVFLMMSVTGATITRFSGTLRYDTFSMTAVGALALIFATFAPIPIFSYRFSLKKQEFYRQAPISNKTLLLTRVLIMAIMLTIGLTVAVLMGFTFEITATLRYETLLTYNLGKILLSYLCVLVGLYTQLIISCFLASLCNTGKMAVFTLLFGNALLCASAPILTSYVSLYLSPESGLWELNSFYMFNGFSWIVGQGTLLQNSLIYGAESYLDTLGQAKGYMITIDIVSMAISIFLAIGACIPLFIFDEPSAEYAGKSTVKSVIPDIAYHGFFTLIFLISMTSSHSLVVLLVIFELVCYYFLNCARNSKMSLNVKDLIFMGCAFFVPLTINLILIPVTGAWYTIY